MNINPEANGFHTSNKEASPAWAGVVSLSLGVFGLVTAEFLPASLLTPISQDLHVSIGAAGQSVTMADVTKTLRSDLQCATVALDMAVRNFDLLAACDALVAAARLEADAIVRRFDDDAAHGDLCTAVDDDPVRIRELSIVVHRDALDNHITAAHEVDRPHRRIFDDKAFQPDLAAVLEHQDSWALFARRIGADRLVKAGAEGGARGEDLAVADDRDIMLLHP